MPTPAEQAASRLSWELDSWTSMELQSRQTFTNYNKHRGPGEYTAFVAEYHYVETADGKRFFEQTIVPRGDDKTISIDYCDGKLSANKVYSSKQGIMREQVNIQHTFGNEDGGITRRPDPLKYFYVGLDPLDKVLPRATYLGTAKHLKRTCERFLFTNVRTNATTFDFVYWLDAEHSTPVKVECFADAASREANKPISIWKATSLDSVKGHHLPLHSELQDFVKSGPDAEELCYQYDTAVESVQYDKVFDSSMFWPKIGPETSVIDLVNNTYSSPKIDSSKVVTATSGKVITATPTDNSWSFSGILMGCGVVILVAACVLRWRAR